MSTTSKSPRRVAAVAYEIGRRSLPVYASRFSRKDFTQPQLFVCLVLRRFHKTDYRGIVAILQDNPTLCEDLDLTKVPHFTTLQKAERRLLDDRHTHALLTQSVALYFDLDGATDEAPAQAQRVGQVAADSTGFELNRAGDTSPGGVANPVITRVKLARSPSPTARSPSRASSPAARRTWSCRCTGGRGSGRTSMNLSR